jgi:Outer membrane protein beta-barrel domain
MKKLFISAAASIVACAAHAGGFYVGGQLGTMSVKNWTQDSANRLVALGGGASSSSQDTGVGASRFFAGYNFNNIVGLELGYLNSGEVKGNLSGKDRSGAGYDGSFTIRTSGFDLSTIVHPFEVSHNGTTPPSGLYLRAGISNYTTRIDATNTAASSVQWFSSSKTGNGTLVGLGYDLKLGPGALRFDLTAHQSMADLTNNDSTALSVGYLYQF